MNFKKFINRKTVISLSLVVLISTGAYFGIKSKAASNSSTNTAYATGYEEMTEEDREWLYDNATIVDSAEDFYDLMEDGELDKVYNDKDAKEADEKDYAEGKTLRTAVDNSQSLYFPPIKTQGSVGSCCSFANVYYQFTYTYNKSVETRSKGDEYLYSPMWTYEQAYMNAAPITRILMEQGAVSCKYLPIIDDVSKYESGEVAEHNCHANAEIQREARKHRISGIYILPDIQGSDITGPDSEELIPIKTALDNGEVLSFTAEIGSYNVDTYKIKYDSSDDNFKDTSNKKYKGEWICPRCDRDGEGLHRMTLVGYDDNIWVDINQNGVKELGEMGAFKIANSWGTDWGNKGFMWVSYDALNRLSSVSADTKVPLGIGKYPFKEVMGYIVKDKYPEAYAQFTVKTDHIASIDSGYIIASNSKEEHEYRINVFDMKFYDFTFDGTRKTSTGTFIYPLDNVVEDVDKNFDSYNWKFRFTDTADEYPLEIVDVNIVKGDKIYKPKLPGKVKCDGNTVDIDMSTIANNGYEGIVLNYEGKTDDYIHYSVNGKWTEAPGVPLIKIGDKSMFVINKKTSDKFVCCFNDGKGNWDNNDTKDYTISEGFYNIKDKKVNKYGSSINDAPYEAQLIADSYGPVTIGNTIKLSVDELGNAD
ncbi:MAG: hypothetical protein K6G26_08560, partial [Lachnospiraceae bacterium]|nr:hypothetical protein [Lachnospiraceae bacterium]